MKNSLFVFTVILLSFLTYSSNAQEANSKNYLLSNISYSFFGSGDLSGSAVGIAYHHMFFDKFGVNISYSKATASGSDNYLDNYTIENADIIGDNPAFSAALYNSANIGLTYRTTAGTRHELFSAAGLNYKSVKSNYIRSIQFNDHIATINSLSYQSEKEFGVYASIDYLFFITEGFAVGLHGAFEFSSNGVINSGVSLAYRF